MRKQREREDEAGLDPIALTFALWLGLVVGVAGFTRLSQIAATQAALDEAAGRPTQGYNHGDPQPFMARTMAFGG